jgi:Mrp family chromosome partitioning ATPase
VPIDTFPPEVRARRDSLRAELTELGELLEHVERAPLPASYRALGMAPSLRGEPRVVQLLDSLAAVEQTRSAFDVRGGVDPVFLTLTARAADIGRAIQAIAVARYAALRLQLTAITPVVPRAPAVTVPDIAPLVAARDSAVADSAAAVQRLARARVVSQALDEEAARVRERVTMGAPPTALLAASAVVALAVGFAVALVLELRQPCVADTSEAEEASGARVLAVVRPQPNVPERGRRQADRLLPPLIHPLGDSYQLLYAQLADSAFNLPLVAVVGDRPMVTAVVAANLAAVAARQPRATLLVDADVEMHSASTVAACASAPGMADVLEQRVDWAEAVATIIVGRDRTLDVLPSGTSGAGPAAFHGAAEAFGQELAHLGRRYDTVVVSAPVPAAGGLPISVGTAGTLILCVRAGRMRLSALSALSTALAARGTPVQGIVLWAMDEPRVGGVRYAHRERDAVAGASGDGVSFAGEGGSRR